MGAVLCVPWLSYVTVDSVVFDRLVQGRAVLTVSKIELMQMEAINNDQ